MHKFIAIFSSLKNGPAMSFELTQL